MHGLLSNSATAYLIYSLFLDNEKDDYYKGIDQEVSKLNCVN
jgi:hypothetical protein